MAQFYGIMDGSGDNWGVRVPDLPGCHGGGSNPGEALADAISAAREWAEYRAGKGFALPSPTPLDRLVREEVQANEVIVNIPVLLDSGRPVRANLSLDAALLADIDQAAKQRGLTRSGFIASAAREKIWQRRQVDKDGAALIRPGLLKSKTVPDQPFQRLLA